MIVVRDLEVVRDATFIHLKMHTRPFKTAKEEAEQWLNDVSHNPFIKLKRHII
jgi:hypothetical protein